MSKFKNMADVRKANLARGHFFFSDGAMSFFNSRVMGELCMGRYFITGESPDKDWDSPERRYTVRFVKDDGSITEITGRGIREFETVEDAKAAMRAHYDAHSDPETGEVPSDAVQ